MEAFLSTLRAIVDDPAVEIIKQWGEDARPVTPPSPLDSELFRALERVASSVCFRRPSRCPRCSLAPRTQRSFARRGVQCYGIGSVGTEEDRNRIHGNDERLSISGLRTFLEFLHSVVMDVAAAK